MRPDADKRMKTAQRRYNEDHARPIHNAPKKTEARQYVYLNRTSLTTFVTGCLVTETYSKLLSVETGVFREIEVSPMIVMIDEHCIRHTVSMSRDIVAPANMQTPIQASKTKGDEIDVKRNERTLGTPDWKRRILLMSYENSPWIA